MLKTKKMVVVGLMICLLMTSFMANVAFAYIGEPTFGITKPSPSEDIFYNPNGSVKTVYTINDSIHFSFLDSTIDLNKSVVYVAKETSIGSGEYGYWQSSYYYIWGGGNQFGSACGFGIKFPSEGRYRVLIYAKRSDNTIAYTQDLKVVYHYRKVVNDYNFVNDVSTSSRYNFYYYGGKLTVNATLQDLSGKGITASDVRIGLANMEAMRASYGRASLDWAKDIKVTRSTVNANEYYITGTVDATYFNNRSGEYYIDLYVLDSNRKGWTNWGGMFSTLEIK